MEEQVLNMAKGYLGAVQNDLNTLIQKRNEIDAQLERLQNELQQGSQVIQAYEKYLAENAVAAEEPAHEVVEEPAVTDS